MTLMKKLLAVLALLPALVLANEGMGYGVEPHGSEAKRGPP